MESEIGATRIEKPGPVVYNSAGQVRMTLGLDSASGSTGVEVCPLGRGELAVIDRRGVAGVTAYGMMRAARAGVRSIPKQDGR